MRSSKIQDSEIRSSGQTQIMMIMPIIVVIMMIRMMIMMITMMIMMITMMIMTITLMIMRIMCEREKGEAEANNQGRLRL